MPLENIEKKRNIVSRPEGQRVEQKDTREISEVSGGVSEALPSGDLESVEAMGHVSEKAGEKIGENHAGGGKAVKVKTQTAAQVKAQLLKKSPSTPEMKREVEREIRKEIAYLHKKAMKMVRSPKKFSYFEITNVMRKIRELKGILRMIVKASVEGLKTLWLRFVHGLS